MMPSNEDCDRMPDGVPHSVVGLTALCSLAFALVVVMLLGGWIGSLATPLAIVAPPACVLALVSKATRERDRAHPSR